jgi:hypothetical protein
MIPRSHSARITEAMGRIISNTRVPVARFKNFAATHAICFGMRDTMIDLPPGHLEDFARMNEQHPS